MAKKVFIAYPSQPPDIGQTIERMAAEARQTDANIEIQTWRREDLGGQALTAPIIAAMEESDVVVADITGFNFNVIYELGYAVGIGKRVLPVRYCAISADLEKANEIGILDTLIHEQYSNSYQLYELISKAQTGSRIATDFPPDDHPLYLITPEHRTDDISQIFVLARKAGLRERSFDPSEQPRLGASQAVRSVATSSGVVLPLLGSTMAGAESHNIRVAFVAGVAHGLQKPTLILKKGGWPAPLDIRDETVSYDTDAQLRTAFQEFAPRVHDARFSAPPKPPGKNNRLAILNLGDPAAENEEGQLADYFLERDEFRRVLNGDANVVVGRKGSGKTAVFMQVRDRLRASRSNVVLDLNPEAYQLRKLKDLVLKCLAEGTREALL
ncbi:MAG: hypothetical protein WA138_06805, partial [Parvibaculum sp.]